MLFATVQSLMVVYIHLVHVPLLKMLVTLILVTLPITHVSLLLNGPLPKIFATLLAVSTEFFTTTFPKLVHNSISVIHTPVT
jgi:hypothetical protein